MANTDTNTVSVIGKFDVKTILTILGIVFGILGFGTAGISLTGNVPTQQTVQNAADSLVLELRLLRGDVRELKKLREDVQDNQQSIEALRMYQLQSDSTNRAGLGVLWEQQNLLLQGLNSLSNKVDTLNQNPFQFP